MPLLSPEERAKIWLALIPYVYAKLNPINVLAEDTRSQTNVILANKPTLELPGNTQAPTIADLLRIAAQPDAEVIEENDDEKL